MNITHSLAHLHALIAPWMEWWFGEMRSLLDGLLDRIWPSARTVTEIRLTETGAEFQQRRGNVLAPIATLSTSEGERDWPALFAQLPADAPLSRTDCQVALTPSQVLMRRLSLPAAAASRWREVLRLRLAWELPLRAEAALFDGEIVARAANGQRIEVECAEVKRREIDALVAALAPLRFKRLRIGLPKAATTDLRFDFASHPRVREAENHPWDRRLGLSAAILATLLVIVLGTQLIREHRIVGDALRKAHVNAEAAAQTRSELVRLAEDANAIRAFANASRPALTLSELSRVLPDDTWIQQLQIEGSKLHLVGISSRSGALVGELQRSRLLQDITLDSTASTGIGTGQDRFEITTQVGRAAP